MLKYPAWFGDLRCSATFHGGAPGPSMKWPSQRPLVLSLGSLQLASGMDFLIDYH